MPSFAIIGKLLRKSIQDNIYILIYMTHLFIKLSYHRYASIVIILALLCWSITISKCNDDFDKLVAKIPVMYRKSIIRIINGQSAPNERYPFSQVSLSLKNEHQCGGSVVAPDIILSAAHCRYWFDSIHMNQYDLTKPLNTNEVFQSINTSIHPNFDPDTFRNDYMLIQLNGRTAINPVRMNNNSYIPIDGMDLKVLGWGTTNNSNPMNLIFPTILQMGSLSYISNDQCMSFIVQDKSLYQGEIYPEMMCGASFTNRVDACAGDSGGPLIIEGKAIGLDVLVGLVSWGRGCAIYPGVYSRISAEYQWLREQICYMSIEPPLYLSCSNTERNPKYSSTTQSTLTLSPATSAISANPSATRSPTAMASDQETSIHEISTTTTTTTTINTIIRIEIQLDTKSNETSWSIYSSQGSIVIDRPQGTYSDVPSTLVVEEIMLLPDQIYTFVIVDTNGDGICCSEVNHGWFRISLKHIIFDDGTSNTKSNNNNNNNNNNTISFIPLIDGSGEFGRSSRNTFQTVYPPVVYTVAPSISPTTTIHQQQPLPTTPLSSTNNNNNNNNRFDYFYNDSNANISEQSSGSLISDSIIITNDKENNTSSDDQSSTSSFLLYRIYSSTTIFHYAWMLIMFTISMLDY